MPEFLRNWQKKKKKKILKNLPKLKRLSYAFSLNIGDFSGFVLHI